MTSTTLTGRPPLTDAVEADLRPVPIQRGLCPPEHPHDASHACYALHKCGCDLCRAGNTRRHRDYRRNKAYGRQQNSSVDISHVREHLLLLVAYGMGYTQIAQIAGVPVTGVRVALYGRREMGARYGEIPRRIDPGKATLLLAVQPDLRNLAGGTRIPARGTVRRLQALARIGWSQPRLAARLGVSRQNMSRLIHAEQVTVRVHRQVAVLFDALWDQLPPRAEWRDKIAFERARNAAHHRGWLPPLAWDDIDHDVEPPTPDDDDPAADIDEIVVELAVAGDPVRMTAAELREAVRRLHRGQLSDNMIASRLHVATRTVFRIRQLLGLPAAVGHDRLPIVA